MNNKAYVADAHAIAYYLRGSLPTDADKAFRQVEREEGTMCFPAIALAEIIYVFEKTKKRERIWEMFNKIDEYPTFLIHPLGEQVLKMVPEIELNELHDRIIVATSKLVKAKLVTKDKEIQKSDIIETIW
ncbi:MAG: PIN domain-containing protein [Candidatus Korarchaeota archaeon]|nr:PIN domain-containing protein [Candidatus Korarchaeota archaeon]NIU84092.1 PIN domain-containing protein [Candidatus Thorarchaeota archaeon]NIW14236.1 PIN domain-containing protein [Candidatus Thorarchaeota archaeon]NIW52328.1 PIN domain-containing protein [Candidatus Korarchaeota archaeon]